MFIIAEAGLNFMGSAEKAIEYCEVAKDCGADAVKFQITDCGGGYSKKELEKYEIKFWEWRAIKQYCDKIGIEFIATPSSTKVLNYLISLKCKTVKIGSDRAGNMDLITEACKFIEMIIVSTGYYNFNYTFENVIKMFCVSLYPCKKEWINWDCFTVTMQGFSDHTLECGKEWAELLVSKKIEYYEKHFKLDDNCIDSAVSLNPIELKSLIKNIRELK